MSEVNGLVARIHAALPQTQCTRCGYPDCAAYAQAVADGQARINQCPPGGAEGIARLAAITGQPVAPLNPDNGLEGPRHVAVIDEAWCIGCTLCLDACPTDAIVGSNKLMHTVVEPCCTGCELCIPVCPVDCIGLENVTGERTGWAAWSDEDAQLARKRYEIHSYRRMSSMGQRPKRLEIFDEENKPAALQKQPPPPALGTSNTGQDHKRSIIEAALARARAKRSGP